MAGPTTLLAMLNSLQMGFRTLALEKRSAEVWEVLGAVKTEFAKFGAVLDKTKKKLKESIDERRYQLAEMENVRRIAAVDVRKAREYAAQPVAKGLLLALDNIESALRALPRRPPRRGCSHPVSPPTPSRPRRE